MRKIIELGKVQKVVPSDISVEGYDAAFQEYNEKKALREALADAIKGSFVRYVGFKSNVIKELRFNEIYMVAEVRTFSGIPLIRLTGCSMFHDLAYFKDLQ